MPFREVLNPQSLDIYCFWKSALTPVQRAITFPDHPLPVSTKSHSSTLVFLIESGNAAKRINAFWADVEHIGSHLHLEELLSLKHTSRWLVLDSETPRWSVLYYRPRKKPHIKVASKHSKQDVSSPPTTPPSSTCQPSPKETAFWFSHTQQQPFLAEAQRWADFCLVISTLFIWHSRICHSDSSSIQSKQWGMLYRGLSVFLSLILSTSTRPLSFSASVSASLHLPLTSLHPVSLCAGAWTVSAACNTNYCALLGNREQRGESTTL